MGGRAARRAPDRHDRHRVGQDARVQPAGARRARGASRRTARSTSIRRRRSRRTRRARSASSRCPRVRAAIYDGDTPQERRWQIRKWANLVLTNPDMLHIGVLPRHDLWADVLHNLRYVVVDEAHVYRGVFGSHVANVLRRLRRLARVYGAEPQFLLASATIANPGELAHSLLGVEATVIGDDARAARRAHDRAVEPRADRRRARPARERARRRGAPDGRSSCSATCGRSASRRAASRRS